MGSGSGRWRSLAPVTLFAALGALGSFACNRTAPSRYAVGAHECSMTPEWYACDCDGKTRLPTAEEKRDAICGSVALICEGRVSGCKPAAGIFGRD